jgi:AcrR family transcriptional regulator
MLSRPPLATTPPPGTGTAGHRTSGRRAPGRPPGGVLDRSRITQAGLALIGQAGYSGLTMASLARHLNVSKSALYNHVTSKDDILRLIEEHVIAQVDVTAFTTHPWEEAVRVWAFSYRDVFSRHTPLIPVIAVLPVTNAPKTLAMYEAVSNGFRSARIPNQHIIPAIVALESFIFGAAYDVNAPHSIFEPGTLADSAPSFTSAVTQHAHQGHRNPADTAFTLGLNTMIQGIGNLRTAFERKPEDRHLAPAGAK